MKLTRTILLGILIFLVGVLNFETTLAAHEFPQIFPNTLYLILTGCIVALFLGFWVDHRLRHPLTLKEVWIFVLMVYPIISGFINQDQFLIVDLNQAFSNPTLVFTLSNRDLFQGMVYGASVGLLLYIYVFFAKDAVAAKWFYYLLIALVLTLVFLEITYSLIVEWPLYVELFNKLLIGEAIRFDLQSFTTNPNIFAFNLIMGVYALGFLYKSETRLRWIYPVMAIPIIMIMIFVLSKTVLLSLIIYLLVYFLMSLYQKFHNNLRQRTMAMVGVIAGLIVGLNVIFFVPLPLFTAIRDIITDFTAISFGNRLLDWQNGLALIRAGNLWLGYGFGISNQYLAAAIALPIPEGNLFFTIINDRFHNGYLEMVASFGLIGTFLLLVLHGGYVLKLIRFSHHHKITIAIWAMMISFAVQMMFEDRLVFRPDLSGVFFLALLILPFHQPTFYASKDETHQ